MTENVFRIDEWRATDHHSSHVIEQLRWIIAMNRQLKRAMQAGISGRGYSDTEGAFEVEKRRFEILREIEQQIDTGRLTPGLSAADYHYAYSILNAGTSTFAEMAEQETKRYLRWITGATLLDLTSAKNVHGHGPDGIFIGGVQMLGFTDSLGLEVKTTTSTGSLGGNINKMLAVLKDKDGNPAKDKYRAWQRKAYGAAVESLRIMTRDEDISKTDRKRFADIADEITRRGSDVFATLLVVRNCTREGEEAKISDISFEVFDAVLSFDLYGFPVYDPRNRFPDTAFDELYNAAEDFNAEKAAEAWRIYANMPTRGR